MTSRSAAYYASHPEAAAKKVRTQARINRRPSERRRRALLNKERRRRGIDGKGGGDISHTQSGGTVLEDPSTNRARNGHGKQARLKADSLSGGLTPRRLLPRARRASTTRATKGRACGKSFIPGTARCSKPIQRQAAQRSPSLPRVPAPAAPATPSTPQAARFREHYKLHRNDTPITNRQLTSMFGDLAQLPGTLPADLRLASKAIRSSGVNADPRVIEKLFSNQPAELAANIEGPFRGIHYPRGMFGRLPADLNGKSSFIYVRPARAPGASFKYDPAELQHEVHQSLNDIAVANAFQGNTQRPFHINGDMPFEQMTSVDEAATLIHEMGHAIHYRASYANPTEVMIRKDTLPFVIHRDRAIQKHPMGFYTVDTTSPLFRSDVNRFSSRYGLSDATKNRKEMFAEAFVVYTTNGERMRREAPYLYSWMSAIVRQAAARS